MTMMRRFILLFVIFGAIGALIPLRGWYVQRSLVQRNMKYSMVTYYPAGTNEVVTLYCLTNVKQAPNGKYTYLEFTDGTGRRSTEQQVDLVGVRVHLQDAHGNFCER